MLLIIYTWPWWLSHTVNDDNGNGGQSHGDVMRSHSASPDGYHYIVMKN